MSDSESEECSQEAAAAAEARLHEQLFNELMHEVQHGPPGARLSARLRAALERLSPARRRALVSRTRAGCAPLFVAAARGGAELVEYLVHVCCAPLEQRGRYRAPPERAAHRVTPLWAAAVAGRLHALRVLADAGADVDAPSDSGSTPARSACFMSHAAAVRLLAERGADLARPNHHGGTCLINSVQSPRLLRFLLARGAAVDARDAQRKTALHYAVQEHRPDAARALLAAGASPHACSRAGDDALRTAALRGAHACVELLLARARYPPARRADALELLGATQLDEFNDPAAALAAWRRATALRAAAALRKRPVRACSALAPAREWRSAAELAALEAEPDALRTQALLVAVRVLGPYHRDTLFRFMYRGAAHADALRYGRCAALWAWVLAARVRRDTLLSADTAHVLCALTRLLQDMRAAPRHRAAAAAVAARLLRRVAAAAHRAAPLARLRPACRTQQDAWARALRCALHLAALAGEGGERALAALQRTQPRTAAGDTLLHLACSRLAAVRSSYFAEAAPALLPNVRLARLLLAAGADARARNCALATPLHVAAVPYNFSTELAEVLLAGGAHACTPNRHGDAAAALLPLCRASRVRVLQHVSLACLAARALLAAGAALPAALPATLHAFLDLHRALPDPRAPPDAPPDREPRDADDDDLDLAAPPHGDARY